MYKWGQFTPKELFVGITFVANESFRFGLSKSIISQVIGTVYPCPHFFVVSCLVFVADLDVFQVLVFAFEGVHPTLLETQPFL